MTLQEACEIANHTDLHALRDSEREAIEVLLHFAIPLSRLIEAVADNTRQAEIAADNA
jgi:hypothetical protein